MQTERRLNVDWWNILIFGVIPVLSVLIVFCVNKKFLWIAPLISVVLAFVAYMIALGIINLYDFLKFFSNNEYRGFFILAMFLHFAIAVILTAITYIVTYILKLKQNIDN